MGQILFGEIGPCAIPSYGDPHKGTWGEEARGMPLSEIIHGSPSCSGEST